jgi:RNA polymerase sigma-70 factor (ECF subfamily)
MDAKDEQLANLIARCALKDQAALKQLYASCASTLNGIAYRIIRSDELSSEILQDAFVQIWDNAASYRPHLAKPLTWMASIVRYRALDRLRAESKHRQRVLNAEEEAAIIERESDEQTPQSELENTQHRAAIYHCLDQLNDKVGKSIELAYLYGYSREELAEALNTKVNTVKSWLRRGSERLKECLESKVESAS